MPLLLEPIPSQAFEIVGERVVDILAEELAGQMDFNNDFNDDFPSTEGIDIYHERFTPFAITEMPAVNVMLQEGTYGNEDARQSDGTYIYAIDCYTSSESVGDGVNEIEMGDKIAKLKVHKLMGACRAILKAPVYNNLGFDRPYLCRVTIVSFSFAEATSQDGMHTAYGRLLLSVRAVEKVEIQTPRVMKGYETKYKIAESEKGFITIGGI